MMIYDKASNVLLTASADLAKAENAVVAAETALIAAHRRYNEAARSVLAGIIKPSAPALKQAEDGK